MPSVLPVFCEFDSWALHFSRCELICPVEKLTELFATMINVCEKLKGFPWEIAFLSSSSAFEMQNLATVVSKKHSLFHLGWNSIRCESLHPLLNSSGLL